MIEGTIKKAEIAESIKTILYLNKIQTNKDKYEDLFERISILQARLENPDWQC